MHCKAMHCMQLALPDCRTKHHSASTCKTAFSQLEHSSDARRDTSVAENQSCHVARFQAEYHGEVTLHQMKHKISWSSMRHLRQLACSCSKCSGPESD